MGAPASAVPSRNLYRRDRRKEEITPWARDSSRSVHRGREKDAIIEIVTTFFPESFMSSRDRPHLDEMLWQMNTAND